MKNLLLVFLSLLAINVFAQSKDVDVYKEASTIKDPAKKIEAMHKFINGYSSSNYVPRAYSEIVGAYISLKNTDSALVYASKYINAIPPDARMNPYNSVAYLFGSKKIGLDTALAYIDRAIVMAKEKNARNIGQYLDTKAMVLYQQGKFAEALQLQNEAIKGHENDPEYLSSLAKYQEAAGQRKAAIENGAKVIFLGDPENILEMWNGWIAKEANETDQQKLKKDAAEKVINDFMAVQKNPDEVRQSRLAAAYFYAKTGVNLDIAKQWANEGLKNINNETSVEEKVLIHKTLGLLNASEKNYDKALAEMNQVKDLVDPWDADFWLTLGNIYQQLKQNDKALDAYVSCLFVYPAEQVQSAASELIKKMNLSDADLQSKIDAKQKEGENFEPGKSKVKTNGNVLLAELFTGAECNPCQSADIAFDKLAEYYPRNSVAILQFHLNIPGPDPLTNYDTYDRYVYYGANFGTPTAILNGKDLLTGGGPRALALNRFTLFRNSLDNMFDRKPVVNITGKAKRDGNNVMGSYNVKGNADSSAVLYIALADKSVKYTGSNGIDHHIFVVRDMLNMPSAKGEAKFSFDINKIQSDIKAYLDDPTKHKSWRPTFGAPNWKARPETLDLNNLAVVVWLQDKETKEVLNAYYMDVK